MTALLPFVLLAAGCRPDLDENRGIPPLVVPTNPTTPTDPTPTTHDTDTGTPAFDCDTLPEVGEVRSWLFPNVAEEFIFDAHGYLVTRADSMSAVVQTAYDGRYEVAAPFQSWEVAGLDVLLDGDVVVADEAGGSLKRVSMDGAVSVIQGSLWDPNSLAVHQDGHIYSTSFDAIYRVDPDTGDQWLIAESPNRDLDGLAFSPGFGSLWYNEDSTGVVHRVELDPQGRPVEDVVVDRVGEGWTELDGMTTDVCGNLYIAHTNGRVSRLGPEGEAADYVTVSNGAYTTSLHFGSGVGGWEADHLYVMDRGGRLFDVDVGIPGAPEPHIP